MNIRIIKLSVLLLISMLALTCPAQKKSVIEKQPKITSGSVKLNISQRSIDNLLDEANTLKTTNRSEALATIKEALGLSLAQGDIFNEGKCYIVLGQINEDIEEWKLALENFTDAHQKLSNNFEKTVEFTVALRGMGNAHLKLHHYDQALQYLNQALSTNTGRHQRNEIRLSLSEVYYEMARYTEALKVLDQTEETKVHDESHALKTQNLRAKIYARMNKLDEAQHLYDNSFRISKAPAAVNTIPKREADDELIQSTKEEISSALVTQKRYDDEINLRNQSIVYNQESKNLAEVTKDKYKLSQALVAKGETLAAIKALTDAATIADTINKPKDQARAFLALAALYEKHGKTTAALQAYKKYSEAVGKTEKQNQIRLTEKSELIKQQKDIEELSKFVSIRKRDETIAKGTLFRQQLIIYGLLVIILIILTASYFIYKNAMASKIANQLLALKSLRSQMNPHFIFNALNSVNHFIAQQDERTANKFLSEFSQLMRLVLEHSQEDFIPLYKEFEILSLYLKLEHYRFRDKFDYEIKIAENINPESFMVPPMLIQPYIENAVWHGLRYKETKGHLTLSFTQQSNHLTVEITDNGIGRKKSMQLKTENQKKHQSTGLKNIDERLKIINKVYKANYHVSVADANTTAGEGTHVRLHLPLIK